MSGGSAAAPYLSSCTVPSYLSTHFNFLHNAKEFVKTFDFDEPVILCFIYVCTLGDSKFFRLQGIKVL